MIGQRQACPRTGISIESIEMKVIAKSLVAAALAVVVSITAQAEGDAIKGEKVFRKCKACHSTHHRG
jgi:cytochrome c2